VLFVVGFGCDGDGKVDCEGEDKTTGLTGLNHLNELRSNVLNERHSVLDASK